MSKSPSIKKESNPHQTFFEVLKYTLKEKKIHKLEWKDKEYYGHLVNGKLCLHKPDGKDYQWIISDGDMSGEDWITL